MQMEMMNILGSCDSSLIGWRGEFPHLSSSKCFETARFVRILESNYKLSARWYKVVSLDRIMFDFVSASSSTSGEAEFFRFIFAIKGLLVSLGRQFDLYCDTREAHFHYVAARHAFDFCAGLKIKDPSLIKTMFPLHVYHGCLYLSCLGGRSLETILGECSVEVIVGEILGKRNDKSDEENTMKNAFALFLGCVFGNHKCRDESIFTPCGRGPRGFALGIPANGCLSHISCLEYSTTCTRIPRAPQGSPGSRGVLRNFANTPRAPQVPVGTCLIFATSTSVSGPGAPQVPLRSPWVRRNVFNSLGAAQGLCVPRGVCFARFLGPGAPEGSFGIISEVQRFSWLARTRTLEMTLGIGCEYSSVETSIGIDSSSSL